MLTFFDQDIFKDFQKYSTSLNNVLFNVILF